MAGGERERELQRQLAQAALQAEAALESQAAALATDSEATVQRLLQQRDTANAALNVSNCTKRPCHGRVWGQSYKPLGEWVVAHHAALCSAIF